jgi:glycosyltransferase involved in cell wall biosynthesis
MIPVFNCSSFLSETLAGVLLQHRGPAHMEIVVVDDASTDTDVAELVNRIGQGRVRYIRQPENVGSLRNFETCLNQARGYFIHLLHGDDRVHTGYYQAMTRLFEQNPTAGAAFCRHEHIDERGKHLTQEVAEAEEDGLLTNWSIRLALRQRIQYCSISVRRSVYEEVGGFYGVVYGEDWEMWMRIAQHYPMAYTPRILAAYRHHTHSVSGHYHRTAQNLRDLQWVIETIQAYVPQSDRKRVKKKSLKNYAYYGLDTAHQLWASSNDREGVRAQLREAVRMHRDLWMYLKIARLYSKIFVNL